MAQRIENSNESVSPNLILREAASVGPPNNKRMIRVMPKLGQEVSTS